MCPVRFVTYVSGRSQGTEWISVRVDFGQPERFLRSWRSAWRFQFLRKFRWRHHLDDFRCAFSCLAKTLLAGIEYWQKRGFLSKLPFHADEPSDPVTLPSHRRYRGPSRTAPFQLLLHRLAPSRRKPSLLVGTFSRLPSILSLSILCLPYPLRSLPAEALHCVGLSTTANLRYSFFQMSRTRLIAAFLQRSNRPGDHRGGLTATVGAGATAFNWSNSVSTACQRTWSLFVSILAWGSE